MRGSCLTLYLAPSPRGGGIGGYQSTTFWDRLLPVRSQLHLFEGGDLVADGCGRCARAVPAGKSSLSRTGGSVSGESVLTGSLRGPLCPLRPLFP